MPEVLAPRAIPSLPLPSDLIPSDPEGGAGGNRPTPQPLTTAPDPPARDVASADEDLPCPLDLVERAERAGVLRELSDALHAPLASVVDSAREFHGYWTIGGGSGKRRRHWLTKLREHVRRAHREHRLRAPGELEHEQREALKPHERQQVDRIVRQATKNLRAIGGPKP